MPVRCLRNAYGGDGRKSQRSTQIPYVQVEVFCPNLLRVKRLSVSKARLRRFRTPTNRNLAPGNPLRAPPKAKGQAPRGQTRAILQVSRFANKAALRQERRVQGRTATAGKAVPGIQRGSNVIDNRSLEAGASGGLDDLLAPLSLPKMLSLTWFG